MVVPFPTLSTSSRRIWAGNKQRAFHLSQIITKMAAAAGVSNDRLLVANMVRAKLAGKVLGRSPEVGEAMSEESPAPKGERGGKERGKGQSAKRKKQDFDKDDLRIGGLW